MPTQVPSIPTEHSFTSDMVARPVNGRDTVGSWVQTSNFLTGRNLITVASMNVPFLSASEAVVSGSMYIQYQKSTAAQYLCFEFEIAQPYGSATGPKSYTIDLGLPTNAVYLASNSLFNTGSSRDLRQIYMNSIGSVARQTVREFVDVRSCVSTSALVFTASWYAMTGSAIISQGHGFRTVTVLEVPRQELINFNEDPGVEELWARPGGDIADSYIDLTSSPKKKYGIQEIVRNMDNARTKVRNQVQIASVLDPAKHWVYRKITSPAVKSALSYGSGTNNSESSNRVFYFRAKNTYGLTTTTVPYNIQVIYSTSGGTKPYLYLNYKAHGAVSYSQVQLNLTVGANKAVITSTVNIPTSGTDQIVDCYLTAVTDGDWIEVHNFWMGEDIV